MVCIDPSGCARWIHRLTADPAAPPTFLAGQITVAARGIDNTYLATASADARVLAANSVTAANNALAANSVVDSNVASVGVSKLISGTVIFTGDAVFSRGTGNPVVDLSSTGLFLYGVATSDRWG